MKFKTPILIIFVTLLFVGSAVAIPCNNQIFTSSYLDYNFTPFVNRITSFDEYDENSNFIQHLSSVRTSQTGQVVYYPPACGCFEIKASAKNLGNGYWVLSKYNWDTGQYEPQSLNYVSICITGIETQNSIWQSFWQPI